MRRRNEIAMSGNSGHGSFLRGATRRAQAWRAGPKRREDNVKKAENKEQAAAANQQKLTPELKAFIAEWKERPGNLIMVLHRVQESFGYISREIAMETAALLDVPVAKIYGVITFYHYFKTTQPGRHMIAVCMGTACYLKGGQQLVDELEALLGCGCGETSDDGEFSVGAVRCVGCCGLAPVMTVDGEVYGNLKPEDLAAIVAKHRGA